MTLIPVNTKDLTNQIAKRVRNRILVRPIQTTGKATDENQDETGRPERRRTVLSFYSLLVPGGRVLNPQSYHSAFRISSTRHEEAQYNDPFYDAHFPGNQKLITIRILAHPNSTGKTGRGRTPPGGSDQTVKRHSIHGESRGQSKTICFHTLKTDVSASS